MCLCAFALESLFELSFINYESPFPIAKGVHTRLRLLSSWRSSASVFPALERGRASAFFSEFSSSVLSVVVIESVSTSGSIG